MTTAAGPLYEYTFYVEREVLPEFDRWLAARADEARREQGVVDASTLETRDDDRGRAGRVLQLRCQDDSCIDALLDDLLPAIEASGAEAFGDSISVLERTLREDTDQDIPLVENPDCLNCGTRLRGQYCGNCGQRARNRLISLWQLLSEAFGDLLELDSRLWRTLIPLLIRPGQLTRDYLEGRRARYMPPFRMYLVLSVIFFVVAFFDPRDDLSLLFEPEPPPTPEEAAEAEQEAEETEETEEPRSRRKRLLMAHTKPSRNFASREFSLTRRPPRRSPPWTTGLTVTSISGSTLKPVSAPRAATTTCQSGCSAA